MNATRDQWKQHQPVWTDPIEGETHQDHSVASCTACDWQPAASDNSSASFGSHLNELGAPDYMTRYWDFWAGLVEMPKGGLDRDLVARELADYEVVMEEASKVYSELSGLSKPNTAAHHVIAGAERKYRESHANDILHDLLPEMPSEEARQAVIDFAERLHEGAWQEYQNDQAMIADLVAKRRTDEVAEAATV